MNAAARLSNDEDNNDYEALYLEAYKDWLRAPTVCAKAFYGFELEVYETVGCLSPLTIARLQKQVKPSLVH
jgi:hypothetical protein